MGCGQGLGRRRRGLKWKQVGSEGEGAWPEGMGGTMGCGRGLGRRRRGLKCGWVREGGGGA